MIGAGTYRLCLLYLSVTVTVTQTPPFLPLLEITTLKTTIPLANQPRHVVVVLVTGTRQDHKE